MKAIVKQRTAYSRGEDACRVGFKTRRNPFIKGTEDHREWLRGFAAQAQREADEARKAADQ